MARSRFFAAALVLNVPRFLRLPVFGFFLREYSRYLPDFSFLIMLHRRFADQVDSARPHDGMMVINMGGRRVRRWTEVLRQPKT
jgi:hypothetical protein